MSEYYYENYQLRFLAKYNNDSKSSNQCDDITHKISKILLSNLSQYQIDKLIESDKNKMLNIEILRRVILEK
jgi:hypothetical protein